MLTRRGQSQQGIITPTGRVMVEDAQALLSPIEQES